MKISQINVVYGFGSTGVIVQDLKSKSEINGIECEVVYSKSNTHVINGYRMGNRLSNLLHSLLTRISGKQGYFSCLATHRLIRHFKQQLPDIMHLHNLHGSYINVQLILEFAAFYNIPVVVTLHDCWFYTGGCCHYTHSNCSKWKECCGKCPQRYEEFPALLHDASSNILHDRIRYFNAINNLTVVGVSKWITSEAKYKVFKNANAVTIYNGVDLNFFKVVDVSDYTSYKSIEYLLDIKRKNPKKYYILCPANKWFLPVNRPIFEYFSSRLTDDMCLVFIGKGVDEKLLTDKMINIGFVSCRDEIRAIYNVCDVMINCTREESLSFLNVEVQACGTPVITFSNTGVKETVDGICGFAVENGNPKELWNTMLEVKKYGKSYYSDMCIDWTRKVFDKEKNYLKYIELYKTITLNK